MSATSDTPPLDYRRIADAIERTTMFALDDFESEPIHRVIVGDPIAMAVAEALHGLARRFEHAETLDHGVRIVFLGAHGRAAVIAAVRCCVERPKPGSSAQDDRDFLRGLPAPGIERPAPAPSPVVAVS